MLRSSRSFERRPPANLQPDDVELFADAYTYKTLNCLLLSLGPCSVTWNSIVYRRGRQLFAESVVEPGQENYYRYRYLARQILTGKKVRLGAGSYLLATDAWSIGHFHWFMEVLPKLMLLGARTREFVLMLPDSAYVRNVGIETLWRLSLKFADIVLMRPTEFYDVPNLTFITPVAAPGQVDDQLMRQINAGLLGDSARGSSRLYVSRAKAGFRKVVNEDELKACLEDNGFDTVYPEEHSLSEQIEIFSSCEILVGLHGAGLTNAILMRPKGNIVELRKREKNYGYWHLAESVGHRYFYYNGIPDSDKSLIGRGCNLHVDIKLFESEILRPLLEGESRV